MIMKQGRTILRHIKTAPWPYMTGTVSLLIALGLGATALTHWTRTDLAAAVIFGCWSSGWLTVALFALAAGISRHREYKRIKSMFVRYGYKERILEPLARSRCQRDAALLAAKETGYGIHARAYFMELGYRWYHILPDLVIKNPLSFLSPEFLRSSFMPGKKARA